MLGHRASISATGIAQQYRFITEMDVARLGFKYWESFSTTPSVPSRNSVNPKLEQEAFDIAQAEPKPDMHHHREA